MYGSRHSKTWARINCTHGMTTTAKKKIRKKWQRMQRTNRDSEPNSSEPNLIHISKFVCVVAVDCLALSASRVFDLCYTCSLNKQWMSTIRKICSYIREKKFTHMHECVAYMREYLMLATDKYKWGGVCAEEIVVKIVEIEKCSRGSKTPLSLWMNLQRQYFINKYKILTKIHAKQ